MNDMTCKACSGEGMLVDDEGWRYKCSVCSGTGQVDTDEEERQIKVMEVDENNRLLN